MAATEPREWVDQNDNPFQVDEVVEDVNVRVDLVPQDVKAGTLLIYSGSDVVGYWSFNRDQYQAWGCHEQAPEPTPEPTPEPAPEPAGPDNSTDSSSTSSTPDPSSEPSSDPTPAHAADAADVSPDAGPTDSAADQTPTGPGTTAGE